MAHSWPSRLRKFMGARRAPAPRFHFVEDYRALVKELLAQHPLEVAMAKAVGNAEQFDLTGKLQRQLLIRSGLRADHSLVDIGCGSGRLAIKLRDYLSAGAYTGTDVVPEVLDYARARSPSHWKFELVEGLRVPVVDATADFVVFFSVFTHLLLHESYCYLLDAKRVLKPGGRVVFSFLEFPLHWPVFKETYQVVRAGGRPGQLNEFLSRAAIRAWSRHLRMRIVELRGGSDAFIDLDGVPSPFGQSVCVLEKPVAGAS